MMEPGIHQVELLMLGLIMKSHLGIANQKNLS